MILPNKHLSTSNSLLGAGAMLLDGIQEPCTVSDLWNRSRDQPAILSFQRFVLVLTFLYTIGAITVQDGQIVRGQT